MMDSGLIDVSVFQFHRAIWLIRIVCFPDEENDASAIGNIFDIAPHAVVQLLPFGHNLVGRMWRPLSVAAALKMIPLIQFLKIRGDPAVIGFSSSLVCFLIYRMMRLRKISWEQDKLIFQIVMQGFTHQQIIAVV